jgi:hypothetical protein
MISRKQCSIGVVMVACVMLHGQIAEGLQAVADGHPWHELVSDNK